MALSIMEAAGFFTPMWVATSETRIDPAVLQQPQDEVLRRREEVAAPGQAVRS